MGNNFCRYNYLYNSYPYNFPFNAEINLFKSGFRLGKGIKAISSTSPYNKKGTVKTVSFFQRVDKVFVYTLSDDEKRTQTRKLTPSAYDGTVGVS